MNYPSYKTKDLIRDILAPVMCYLMVYRELFGWVSVIGSWMIAGVVVIVFIFSMLTGVKRDGFRERLKDPLWTIGLEILSMIVITAMLTAKEWYFSAFLYFVVGVKYLCLLILTSQESKEKVVFNEQAKSLDVNSADIEDAEFVDIE